MVATVALKKIPDEAGVVVPGVVVAVQSMHAAAVMMLLPKTAGVVTVPAPKVNVLIPSQETDVALGVAAPVPAYQY
jgi:hypothetical protein